MPLNNKDFFQSKDLSLCATLCCLGYQIITIDKQNSSKAIFCFIRDNQIEQIISDYWGHKLVVDPLAFFNFLKDNKSRIYEKTI